MFAQIRGNLNRQAKGLELLQELQAEEFELLVKRDSERISSLEFSIHELLRQLAVERDELKTFMHGTGILEYARLIPEEEGAEIRALMEALDRAEQQSARQAEKNTSLSLNLLDKSHELMLFLYDQIQPKQQVVYSAKGGYANSRPQAAIFSGRL
ncbi:MAG: flagellar protein FlgN [Deltaproteobacteria bacterium]|jgi:hypothetical protein|nr:flagellar protein FlgN [Deltaproteobacteria bacterium]